VCVSQDMPSLLSFDYRSRLMLDCLKTSDLKWIIHINCSSESRAQDSSLSKSLRQRCLSMKSVSTCDRHSWIGRRIDTISRSYQLPQKTQIIQRSKTKYIYRESLAMQSLSQPQSLFWSSEADETYKRQKKITARTFPNLRLGTHITNVANAH
jgi:hypothetical protein